MQCIYKIQFDNGDFYIGQTSNFKNRKRFHLSTKGKGSPKLEQAFKLQPNPEFTVIEETVDLDAAEVKHIKELKPTLNVLSGGESMRGLNSPRIKFKEEDIREAMDLFINTTLSYKDIHSITDLSYSSVMDLCKGRSHEWIQKEYTEEQKETARYIRSPKKVIYSPDGTKYEAQTVRELNELAGISHAQSLFNSERGSHVSGYSLYPPSKYQITCPDGEKLEVYEFYAKKFFEACGFSKYQISTLFTKGRLANGYRCEKIGL